MTKTVERAIAWFTASLLLVSALAGLAMANILVSLKYETAAPGECISQVTGYNLCWHLGLSQAVCISSLVSFLLITWIAWLRRAK
jgi:hypothetical protein